jgi:hypothetical protein
MEAVDINLMRVVVAAVANMIIGAVWYSPSVFGKKWMKLVGKKQQDLQKGASTAYLGSAISALIVAFVLAYFINFSGAENVTDGALLGVLAWLGFVVTSSLYKLLFQGSSKDLYVLDNGYQLLAYAAMGAILAF